jgi:hypothetical protein
MKKLIAILLLFVLLFNLYGHMALYEYRVFQSDKLFNEQVSKNNYNIDDLVEVKLPVHMPTIQDWKEYTCVCGQVKFKSNCYNYVRLKMTRDTVYLMCIPNYEKTRLINQNIIDARKIADIPVNKKERIPFGKANNLGMYHYQLTQYKFLTPTITVKGTLKYSYPNIVNSYISLPGQPPDAINALS